MIFSNNIQRPLQEVVPADFRLQNQHRSFLGGGGEVNCPKKRGVNSTFHHTAHADFIDFAIKMCFLSAVLPYSALQSQFQQWNGQREYEKGVSWWTPDFLLAWGIQVFINFATFLLPLDCKPHWGNWAFQCHQHNLRLWPVLLGWDHRPQAAELPGSCGHVTLGLQKRTLFETRIPVSLVPGNGPVNLGRRLIPLIHLKHCLRSAML